MKVLVISAPSGSPMHAGEATNTFHLCQQLVEHGVDVSVQLTSVGNVGTGDPRIHVHAIMQSWDGGSAASTPFLKRYAPDSVFLMYIGLMYKFHPMVTFLPTVKAKGCFRRCLL